MWKKLYRKVRQPPIGRSGKRGKKGIVFLHNKLIGKEVKIEYYEGE